MLHTEAEVMRPFGDVAVGQSQQTQVCGQRLSSALKSPVWLGGLGEGMSGAGPGSTLGWSPAGRFGVIKGEIREGSGGGGGGGSGLRCWGESGSVTTASLHFHMWS